ncbi:MAG TPA: class E sortase [Egibacteraceae bacterium]|nr:class E sortase [Actinomycetota bacterium]HWB73132.1 class E sortase [Egibacteraceae bacterium]
MTAPGAAGRTAVTVRALRVLGWTLITIGAVILLYLAYALLFTNLATRSAQADLLEDWELEVGPPAVVPLPGEAQTDAPPAPAEAGEAVAVLEFARPGSASPPVHAGPLFVVAGVGVQDLQRGPGHYPGTAAPGQPGNFAVAGHRTTYGAPFFNLDQLQSGDHVLVTDRGAVRYTYRVVQQRIVGPADSWVIGPDPLGTGAPTLTLTTCHPRFSDRQRLVVFAERLA